MPTTKLSLVILKTKLKDVVAIKNDKYQLSKL